MPAPLSQRGTVAAMGVTGAVSGWLFCVFFGEERPQVGGVGRAGENASFFFFSLNNLGRRIIDKRLHFSSSSSSPTQQNKPSFFLHHPLSFPPLFNPWSDEKESPRAPQRGCKRKNKEKATHRSPIETMTEAFDTLELVAPPAAGSSTAELTIKDLPNNKKRFFLHVTTPSPPPPPPLPPTAAAPRP